MIRAISRLDRPGHAPDATASRPPCSCVGAAEHRAGLVVQVHLRVHRQADAQRMLVEFLGGSSAMRTGTRCTILIQLPDAFCARQQREGGAGAGRESLDPCRG